MATLIWDFSNGRRGEGGFCIEKKRSEGVQGRLKVRISREQLMSRVENFVDDFNDKETTGETNMISNCLS